MDQFIDCKKGEDCNQKRKKLYSAIFKGGVILGIALTSGIILHKLQPPPKKTDRNISQTFKEPHQKYDDEITHYPLLIQAILTNNIQAVKKLSTAQSVNTRDAQGFTPLDYAITQQPARFDIVQILLNAGALLNSVDKHGTTLLIKAISHPKPNLEIIDALLQHGAHLNTQNHVGTSALHQAVHFSHPAIVKKLINNGAYLYPQNDKGQTPLMLAKEYVDEAEKKLSSGKAHKADMKLTHKRSILHYLKTAAHNKN